MERKIIEYKEVDAGNVEKYLKLGYEVYGFPYQNYDGNESGGCQVVVKYGEPISQETNNESQNFEYICRKEWFKATSDVDNTLFNVSIISILILLSFFLFDKLQIINIINYNYFYYSIISFIMVAYLIIHVKLENIKIIERELRQESEKKLGAILDKLVKFFSLTGTISLSLLFYQMFTQN